MLLLSFEDRAGERPGCLLGDREAVIDVGRLAASLGAQAPRHLGDLLSILASGSSPLARALRLVAEGEPARGAPEAVLPLEAVRLRPPAKPGAQILCAGANYRSHLDEMGSMPPPASVLWFTKSPTSVIGPGEPIVLPRQAPAMVDYEGELALVIGRACYRVEEEEALSYVGGYTLLNDVSARDWVRAALGAQDPQEVRVSWGKNLLGKQFPTFCPLGPVVLTADAVADPEHLHLSTRLNGGVVQDASTADLLVGVAGLVAYFSQFFALTPGDIISTGSPAGVGVARTPPVFLSPGDRVEVEVPEIGVLSNPVSME